jgi:hypothetical protein
MGEEADTFFDTTNYTYAHDKSIMAVAEGLVDAAAVDSLIWDYADRMDPEFTSRTKIIWKSDSCGPSWKVSAGECVSNHRGGGRVPRLSWNSRRERRSDLIAGRGLVLDMPGWDTYSPVNSL